MTDKTPKTPKTPAVDDGMTECTVTKKGDDKISTGQHIPGIGDVKYKRGDKFTVDSEIAENLADLGYVA